MASGKKPRPTHCKRISKTGRRSLASEPGPADVASDLPPATAASPRGGTASTALAAGADTRRQGPASSRDQRFLICGHETPDAEVDVLSIQYAASVTATASDLSIALVLSALSSHANVNS